MVRQLLDMSSGIDFSENYMDPAAGIRKLEEAIDWAASKVPGPTGMYPFLGSLERKTAHGDVFDYRSCETDMLGWICEAAAGTPMGALLSELVWGQDRSRIGRLHGYRPVRHRGLRPRESTLRSVTWCVSVRCSWATGFS